MEHIEVKKMIEKIAKLKRFFNKFTFLLNFDSSSAKIAGFIRNKLNKKGTAIGVRSLRFANCFNCIGE